MTDEASRACAARDAVVSTIHTTDNHDAAGRSPQPVLDSGLATELQIGRRNRVTPTCIPIVQRTVKDSSAGTQPLVYLWCMTRTNIDIDDHACEVVMRRFHLTSKRDAVNFALRNLAQEALDLKAARELRGSGWDADLDELRSDRVR